MSTERQHPPPLPRARRPRPSIVAEAERIVYLAKWRMREREAADRLAHTHSVATTRLFPESDVIHVIAVDGQVIGRVRHSQSHWVAVFRTRPVAERDTFPAAVRALTEAAERD